MNEIRYIGNDKRRGRILCATLAVKGIVKSLEMSGARILSNEKYQWLRTGTRGCFSRVAA